MASWALSPVLSGVVASLLFFVVRALVLRSEHSLNRSMIAFPLLVTVTIAIEGETWGQQLGVELGGFQPLYVCGCVV